jgi:hypothetical protein
MGALSSLGVGSVMTRSREGCLGAIWYLTLGGIGGAQGTNTEPLDLGTMPATSCSLKPWLVHSDNSVDGTGR